MYLCTISLPEVNILVRVNVDTTMALYRVTSQDGTEGEYVNDIDADDPITSAIVLLIRDFLWSELKSVICVVHCGAIGQDLIDQIVVGMRPAYAIGAMATTTTRQ